MSEITEKYGYVNTTKLRNFIDSIIDELNALENEIDGITDSSIGDVQYAIDDCSHTAESLKEELMTFFNSDWIEGNK